MKRALLLAALAAIVGVGFLLAGCDDKWPQEKRQCEAVNGINHGC